MVIDSDAHLSTAGFKSHILKNTISHELLYRGVPFPIYLSLFMTLYESFAYFAMLHQYTPLNILTDGLLIIDAKNARTNPIEIKKHRDICI